LFKIVLHCKDKKEDLVPLACYELAEAGHELYDSIFRADADQKQDPGVVRDWLEQLRDQDLIGSLEIVTGGKRVVPWNVLYDREPDRTAFLSGDGRAELWQPFWGVRYNLAVGRKVDPRRRMPLWKDPQVVLIADPQVLPEEEWQLLEAFAQRQGLHLIHSQDELVRGRAERPVLMYWLCHADPSALVLGGKKVSPDDLFDICSRQFYRQFHGLAFLNACQTAEEGREGSFIEALHDAGLSGMVATEERTINVFANRFGLDFLKAFLEDGEEIGKALQRLRGRTAPLGLLYGTYCPPDIHVHRLSQAPVVPAPSPGVMGMAPMVGSFLGTNAATTPLPEHPYRSLAYYDREHRALFVGRDDDVHRFALLMDEPSARIAVLHGETGVGKSSFLRAGLIPFLEEECIGYQFLRDRQEGSHDPILFIRATNDPTGPLAKALCDYCAQAEQYETPLAGKGPVEVDLHGILASFLNARPDPRALRDALRADRSLLGRLLTALAERLPYVLVLVIDQGEEVFTLARTKEDEDNRGLVLEMLRRLVGVPGKFKVIVSLRTEYYGRLIDGLRQGLRDMGGVRDYLLTELDETQLAAAILRPTATDAIPYTSDVPSAKYRFRYEEGAATEIARRAWEYCLHRRDSALPLVQVICTQLYELARYRPDAVIRLQDFDAIGGVKGGMRRHVEGLLARIAHQATLRSAINAQGFARERCLPVAGPAQPLRGGSQLPTGSVRPLGAHPQRPPPPAAGGFAAAAYESRPPTAAGSAGVPSHWPTASWTACHTRCHSPRCGQVADTCSHTRRVPTRSTAPTFHSRCRSVLTLAVAASGTAATASRNKTTIA
jgi:hypothetical protein